MAEAYRDSPLRARGEIPADGLPRRSDHYGRHMPSAANDVIWTASDGAELTATIHRRQVDHSTTVDVSRAATQPAIPVILLHGLSQQRHFWDPVVSRLRAPSIACLDQRAHGDSLLDLESDVTIARCADDVSELASMMGWDEIIVVGHSWGASVALRAAAADPDRILSVALLDGGLWGPGMLGDRASVRERLRPPALGIPAEDLWALVQSEAPYLDSEARAALAPTFVTDGAGLVRTRIGVERHMRVLDGLLDYDPLPDLAAVRCPVWAVVCEQQAPAEPQSLDEAWAQARATAITTAAALPRVRLQRWMGAVHDVPLQWPSLVAGLIDTIHDEAMRAEHTQRA
jgi:pimeloyl-ACP methyl ester carboxylesterase